MGNFDQAINYILKNEGGYVWDPDDSGGPTNFGITQHDLADHRGSPVSPDDVKNLTVLEAKAIYLETFWDPMGLFAINALAIATCVMDTGVLYGPHVGIVFAQRACGATPDGHLGPKSILLLNAIDVKTFIKTYVANIHARINEIVQRSRPSLKFQKGWEARADRLLTLA